MILWLYFKDLNFIRQNIIVENTDENHAVYLLAVWEENKTEYETEDKSKSENE